MSLEIEGYRVEQALAETKLTSIYRCVREHDGTVVAVKTLNPALPDKSLVAELRREFDIAHKLRSVPGVIEVHELVPHGEGNLAIVMEHFGQSLAHRFKAEGREPMALARFFPLARTLVKTLSAIHGCDVVHTDFVPRNILVGDADDDVRVIDFGLSSELSLERPSDQLSRRLTGSLPYLSPEQTGRMNRYLDYRSDFYSLGVCFYELLTGHRPFEADSELEWVHSHISKRPPPLEERRSNLPPGLGGIVLKLLEKNPDERYQSSFGLLQDLDRCERTLAETGECDAFELGTKDVSRVFRIPQKLYGRDDERRKLLGIFDEVAEGRNALALVSGHSGVGKSALIQEISRPLVREWGYLTQGKYDQFQRNTPYTAIATAMDGLVRQLLTTPREGLEMIADRLRTALGANAQVMIDLVPRLEQIIGPQPPIVSLPATEAQNRLQIVVQAFLRVFAREGHPLVLFLDDLQWCDAPTLQLIRRLTTSRELTHFMLIGAYRSNEVDQGHPLSLTFEEIRENRPVHELELKPLDLDAVNQLVADTVHGAPADAEALGSLLYAKAEGNPFFINELLKGLHRDRIIRFDANEGRWTWQMREVEQAEISDNVVDFVLGNLRRLSVPAQDVLKLAACIGNRFDLDTLARVCRMTRGDTNQALMEALQRNLILPLDAGYKFVSDGDAGTDETLNPVYRFQHDRVQQAAYELIGEDQRQAVHLSIGRIIRDDDPARAGGDALLDIVGHLNKALALIDDPDERRELAMLNLAASERARSASAFDAALDYLRAGLSLLPAQPWSTDTELTRALHLEAMQSSYQVGAYEDSEAHMATLLDHVTSNVERARVLSIHTRQLATMGRMEDSIQSAIRGLRLLGLDFEDAPTDEDVARERERERENRAGREIADLVDAPALTEESQAVALALLMEIFPAAFLSGSGNLLPYTVLKSVNICLAHGHSAESAFAYAAYGMVLCGVLDDTAEGARFGELAVALNERSDDIALKSRVIYVYAMFVHHWSHHWRTMTPWFKRGIEAGYQSGDLLYLAYSAQDCIIWDPTIDLDEAAREQEKYLAIVRDCQYQDSFDSGTLFRQMLLNFIGQTRDRLSMDDDTFDEAACVAGMRERKFMTGIANHQIYKAEICLAYGEVEQALTWVEAQDAMIFSSMALPQIVRFTLVAFLTRASLLPSRPEAEAQAMRRRLDQDLAQIRRWAETGPDNFVHLRALMEAELARLDRDVPRAMACYQQAIDSAQENQFRRDEALANERFGQFFLEQGLEHAAEGFLRIAHYRYHRLGAQRIASELEARYPSAFEAHRPLPPQDRTQVSSGSLLSGSTDTELLDFASVMKAVQAISGELVLVNLLRRVMEILLENAGGQRGHFVLRVEGDLVIKATCDAESQAVTVEDHVVTETDAASLLPVSLVNWVLRSRDALVLDDALEDERFAKDPYVKAKGLRSVICMPVFRQREFEGVIYIENNLAPGAFTEDRLEVMRLLAAQASISIENAQLYDSLESKVAARTQALADTLEDLKSAQSKLVQSEKMAGLGTLVAGVAHEINNPVNFVNMGASTLNEDLEEFHDLLFGLLGEDNDPEISEEFQQQFDRFFLALGNIREGTVRIGTIVRDLRTFSRLDEAELKTVPVVENLESTLRLVRAQYHDRVEFVCHWDFNPEIDCLPAQLNQVFMNLMMNACQAIERKARDRGSKADPDNGCLGRLTMTTRQAGDELAIDFADTGTGMSEAVMHRVFEPFFTTKEVGEGTGMGMSISYQIVEKHEGRFEIDSQEGVGTMITLFLPLTASDADREAAGAAGD